MRTLTDILSVVGLVAGVILFLLLILGVALILRHYFHPDIDEEVDALKGNIYDSQGLLFGKDANVAVGLPVHNPRPDSADRHQHSPEPDRTRDGGPELPREAEGTGGVS